MTDVLIVETVERTLNWRLDMRTLTAFMKVLSIAVPVVGVLILLQKFDRKKRQTFPPSAKDIIVTPPTMNVYGH